MSKNGKYKVLYVVDDVSFGGAARSFIEYLEVIREHVFPIVIIRSGACIKPLLLKMGVTYYEVGFPLAYSSKQTTLQLESECVLNSYFCALKLTKMLNKEGIDLVHVNSSSSLLGQFIGILIGVPYIVHVRELLEEQFGFRFISPEVSLFTIKNADRVISISEFVMKTYQNKYGIQTYRIYNGFDVKKYRREMPAQCDNQYILYSGTITINKGVFDAIRAIEIVVKKGYRVKLFIVGKGKGNLVWALNNYVNKHGLSQNVYFAGFQDNPQKVRERCRISLTCSKSEALGRITVESMLGRSLVIGAKSGATEELLDDGRGFLYELNNVNDLADQIMRAITLSDEEYRKITDSAFEYASSHFDSINYSESLVHLYDDVMTKADIKEKEVVSKQLDLFVNKFTELNRINAWNAQTTDDNEKAFHIAEKWLKMKQAGYGLGEYFKDNGIAEIAIYGMSMLGCRLYDELIPTDVVVSYFVDRNPGDIGYLMEFTKIEDIPLDETIVVTVAARGNDIKCELNNQGFDSVITLEEVIDQVYNLNGNCW